MLFLKSIDGKVNICRQNFRDTRYNVDECEVCVFSSEYIGRYKMKKAPEPDKPISKRRC